MQFRRAFRGAQSAQTTRNIVLQLLLFIPRARATIETRDAFLGRGQCRLAADVHCPMDRERADYYVAQAAAFIKFEVTRLLLLQPKPAERRAAQLARTEPIRRV